MNLAMRAFRRHRRESVDSSASPAPRPPLQGEHLHRGMSGPVAPGVPPPALVLEDGRSRSQSPEKSEAASDMSPGPCVSDRLLKNTRVATTQSIDMGALDQMHTDHLFESSGLKEGRGVSSSSTGRHEQQHCKGDGRASPRCRGMHPVLPGVADLEPDSQELSLQNHLSGGTGRDQLVADTEAANVGLTEEGVGAKRSTRAGNPQQRKMSPHSTLRMMSGMDALRVQLESDLVKQTTSLSVDDSDCSSKDGHDPIDAKLCSGLIRASQLLLCLFGVVSFRKGALACCYRNFAFLAVVWLLVQSVIFAVQDSNLLHVHLSTTCYALGGFLGMVSLRVHKLHDLLGPDHRPLERYASNFDFLNEWRWASGWRFVAVILFWACMVSSRVVGARDRDCEALGLGGGAASPLELVTFSLISGLLAALAFCQLHVCCGLELAIDKFCLRLHYGGTLEALDRGVSEWNVLQAILRRSAHTIDSCFLTLNTAVLATLLLMGMEVLQGAGQAMSLEGPGSRCSALWCGWAFAPVALVLYTVFRAAAVTEKCSRVPALVNSWTFDDQQIDHGRQYVVQYITDSAAGFYVKGVRLNGFMALKLAYIFGAALFTAVTQYLLKP